MNKSKRFGIWFNKMFEKALPVSEIDQLEKALEVKRKGLNNLKSQKYRLKAEIEIAEKEIADSEKAIDIAIETAKVFKHNKEDDKVMQLYHHKVRLETELNLNKSLIESKNKLLEKINGTLMPLEENLLEIETAITIVRAKKQFSQTANMAFDDYEIDVKSLLKDVEIDYAATQYKLDDMLEKQEVFNPQKKSNYTEFYNSLE